VQLKPELVYSGVIVRIATKGEVPALVAVNAAILPVPLAASPMAGLSLVQLNTVPTTVPEKLTAVVVALLQRIWLAGAVTVGVGFTVIVTESEVPGHPLAVGMMV
jgi:hypothetical protein